MSVGNAVFVVMAKEAESESRKIRGPTRGDYMYEVVIKMSSGSSQRNRKQDS